MSSEGEKTAVDDSDEKADAALAAAKQLTADSYIRYPVASLHDSPVRCVSLHPKQPLLAIGFDTGVIHVWNVVTHQMMVQLRSPGSIASPISGLCFSPDGSLLASTCESNESESGGSGTGIHALTTDGLAWVREGGSANQLLIPDRICLWNAADNFRYLKDNINVKAAAKMLIKRRHDDAIRQANRLLPYPQADLDRIKALDHALNQDRKSGVRALCFIPPFRDRQALLASASGRNWIRLWDFERDLVWYCSNPWRDAKDINLYKVDASAPVPWHLSRDSREEAGYITELSATADGLLLVGRTVGGKAAVWLLPPGVRLRNDGRGGRLYLHPDAIDRILREKVERDNFLASLERRRHDQLVAEKEEAQWKAQIAATQGEHAAQLAVLERRRQRSRQNQNSAASLAASEAEAAKKESDAAAVASLSAAHDEVANMLQASARRAEEKQQSSSSPIVSVMSVEELAKLQDAAVRTKADMAKAPERQIPIWVHVCGVSHEPHTANSWPCAQADGTSHTAELECQPQVDTMRTAFASATKISTNYVGWFKYAVAHPRRAADEKSGDEKKKFQFKPFHLLKLKPLPEKRKVDKQTGDVKSFFTDLSEARKTRELLEPMHITHEDDEELCFMNTHRDTARFTVQTEQFYRIVFDGTDEDTSGAGGGAEESTSAGGGGGGSSAANKQTVVKYRECPPIRTAQFTPLPPRLQSLTRNYRLVVGARFAVGMLTIDVPHDCLDGKTDKERAEDLKRAADIARSKGLVPPDPKRLENREEMELPNKWKEFELKECLPKGESLVDVGSGGHAMYMALAYHIFGNPRLFGLIRGCVADVLGNDSMLEYFIRQKINMFMSKHINLADKNNKLKYPKISRLKLGILNYDQKGQYQTWNEYLNAVRYSRTPGSTIEAAVAAIIFGVDIQIYNLDGRPVPPLLSLGSKRVFITQLRVVEDGKVKMTPSRTRIPPLKVVKSANYYRVAVKDQTETERLDMIGATAEERKAKLSNRFWSVVEGWKESAFRCEEDDQRPWTWPVWRRVEVDSGYTRDEIKAYYQHRHHHPPHTDDDLLKYLYTRIPDLVHIESEKEQGRELSTDERFNLAHKQRMTLFSNSGGKSGALNAHEKMIMDTRAQIAKQLREKEESQVNLSNISELLKKLEREKRRLRKLQGKPSRRVRVAANDGKGGDDDDDADGEGADGADGGISGSGTAAGDGKKKKKKYIAEPDSDEELEYLKESLRNRKEERLKRKAEEKKRAEKLAAAGVLPKEVEQLLKDSSEEEESESSSSSESFSDEDEYDLDDTDDSDESEVDDEEKAKKALEEEQERVKRSVEERAKRVKEAKERAEKEAAEMKANGGVAVRSDEKYGRGGRRRYSDDLDVDHKRNDLSADDNRQFLYGASQLFANPQGQTLTVKVNLPTKPPRPTHISHGAKWVVWMKYERFAVDHVATSEYGPFFASAEASHFAMANFVDFRPMRWSVLNPAIVHQIEVSVAGPTVQQILKRPEYGWVCGLRHVPGPNKIPTTNAGVLSPHSTLEEDAYYELIPWPSHQRYDPHAATHASAHDERGAIQRRPAYRLNIWSIAHRTFSPFLVGTHFKPIKFVCFPSQSLRKVLQKMGFLKREESFVFAVSSGKGIPDAANGHVSIFHSFRWFNNKDSAADIPEPNPNERAGSADWRPALTTQSHSPDTTYTLFGPLNRTGATAAAKENSNVYRPATAAGVGSGSGGLLSGSIYAARSLPLPMAGTSSAKAAASREVALRIEASKHVEGQNDAAVAAAKAKAAAGNEKESTPTASGGGGGGGGGSSSSSAHANRLVLPSTMPPPALPPAIALAPVPKDASMQIDRVDPSVKTTALTAGPPGNLQTFTDVVTTAEQHSKTRNDSAWCFWPF